MAIFKFTFNITTIKNKKVIVIDGLILYRNSVLLNKYLFIIYNPNKFI